MLIIGRGSFHTPKQAAISASLSVEYYTLQQNKPDIAKQCTMAVAEALYLENKIAFENIPLSRTTIDHIKVK